MVVAVVDEENPYFFKIAQELPEQNAERVGGLLFTGYSAADVYGFGPLDIGAYNPAEDWDPEGSLIDLAIYKTNNDFAYQVPNGEDAGAMSISIRQRLDDLYFNTLATGEESVVLYQIKIDDSIYKLPALINGDQKRIPAYLGSSEVEVSTKCNVHGIPSVGR